MPSALLVRFRPAGPWRLGPDNGAKDRTDVVLHSDAVYSALTIAMRDLGWLDEWLAATAESADPAVRLTSCYPWTARLLMVEPPRSLWPVAQTGKLRWKTARLVPASLIPSLVRGESMKEDQWAVDPVSECLLPVTRNGPMHPPFRVTKRRFATVDRGTGASEGAREVACLHFAPSSGMWFGAVFGSDAARDRWTMRLRSACKLLADTGLGGGRSLGWGRSDDPRFESVADWSRMLTGAAESDGAGESAWWLLSLYSPAASDAVDWKRGNYAVCIRAGRTESLAAWGELKPSARMVSEGSVLVSGSPLTGAARNVASADVPHPVYRSGIAVAVAIPWKESRRLPWMTVESAVAVETVPLADEAEEPSVAEAGEVEELDPLKAGPQAESLPHTDAVEEAVEPLVAETAPLHLDTPEAGPFAGEDVLARQGVLDLDPAAEEPVAPPVEEPPPSEPPAEEPPSEEPPVTEPDAPEPGPSTPEPDPNKEDAGS